MTIKTLPIYPHRSQILSTIAAHDVVLISGATGSGKTTQVPQYLLEGYENVRRRNVEEERVERMKSTNNTDKTTQNASNALNGKKPEGQQRDNHKQKLLRIACTQPRRVAAISIAKRVNEEINQSSSQALTKQSPKPNLKQPNGHQSITKNSNQPKILEYALDDTSESSPQFHNKVGYSVRFDRQVHPNNQIIYYTDGMLLREILSDPLLTAYDIIIIDEIHQRSISSDILVGMMKSIQCQRQQLYETHLKRKALKADSTASPSSITSKNVPEGITKLKLVFMSATLNCEELTNLFPIAPLINVKGRTFPVTVYYTPTLEADHVDATLITTLQLHLGKPSENCDFLIFLPGQEDIEMTQKLLEEKRSLLPPNAADFVCLPLYSALPAQEQFRVFKKVEKNTRKIIISTNIAETSVTISGIGVIIDCGLSKVRIYDEQCKTEKLIVTTISQNEAWQRTGRAGRERAGECYRLYPESTFESMELRRTPDILHVDLSSMILLLKAFKILNINEFDFLTSPKQKALSSALEQLLALGAIETSGELTVTGHLMSQFPLFPSHAVALIFSANTNYNCSDDMLTIVSMLSVENILINSTIHREVIAGIRKRWAQPEGDHLTYLSIYHAFSKTKTLQQQQDFCTYNYINLRAMQQVTRIREQLKEIMLRLQLNICASPSKEAICKCLCAAFFMQSARKQIDGSYLLAADHKLAYLHPTSSLFAFSSNANKATPDCVIYNQLIMTTRRYLRDICVIQPQWLYELSPQSADFHAQSNTISRIKLNENSTKRLLTMSNTSSSHDPEDAHIAKKKNVSNSK